MKVYVLSPAASIDQPGMQRVATPSMADRVLAAL